MTILTATYTGPSLPGVSSPESDDFQDPPQTGQARPTTPEQQAWLRDWLAKQKPRPEPRGSRRREGNDVMDNLLRRQREKERTYGRANVPRKGKKKGGGVETVTSELATRILERARAAKGVGQGLPESSPQEPARDSEAEAAVEAAAGLKEKTMANRIGIPGRDFVERLHIERYQAGESTDEIGLRNEFAMVTAATIRKWFRKYNLPMHKSVDGRYWRPSANGHGGDHAADDEQATEEVPAIAATEAIAAIEEAVEAPATDTAETSWHEYIIDEAAAAAAEKEMAAGALDDDLLIAIDQLPPDHPDQARHQQLHDDVAQTLEQTPMSPAHPGYPAWHRGGGDVPDFWRQPANGTAAVRAQTPENPAAFLVELTRLAKAAGVTGSVSIQIQASFEVTI